MAESVFAYNGNCNTGGGKVLLCACIDDIVLGNVYGTRENIGRHIGNQRYFHIGIVTHFGSEDGIVGRDMEIIGVFGYGVVFGNISEIGFFRRGNDIDFTEEFGLFDGIYCPCSRFEISRFLFQQVERHHTELQAGSAAEVYDIVTGRHI